jgi:hypothetical protein
MGAPDAPQQGAPDRPIEVYKAMFDTWRSQVDSYWQRSNYFALFETAAIGACWHLVSSCHKPEVGAGIILVAFGISLTVIWYYNNKKVHAYVRHWWVAMTEIEERLNLAPNDFAGQLHRKQEAEDKDQKEGGKFDYSKLIQYVPGLFGLAWIALFLIAVVRLLCFL